MYIKADVNVLKALFAIREYDCGRVLSDEALDIIYPHATALYGVLNAVDLDVIGDNAIDLDTLECVYHERNVYEIITENDAIDTAWRTWRNVQRARHKAAYIFDCETAGIQVDDDVDSHEFVTVHEFDIEQQLREHCSQYIGKTAINTYVYIP